jgi:hypothetical protein
MLKLFFEKGEENLSFLPGQNFISSTNNLDSNSYALERVTNSNANYLTNNYFLNHHPQIISYYTCWT